MLSILSSNVQLIYYFCATIIPLKDSAANSLVQKYYLQIHYYLILNHREGKCPVLRHNHFVCRSLRLRIRPPCLF